jgi:hypothetical protein
LQPRANGWCEREALTQDQIVGAQEVGAGAQGIQGFPPQGPLPDDGFSAYTRNEQLNNLHNIYLPKHTFFGPQQARVMACLAAIDHKINVNHPAKKDIDGDAKYTYKFTWDGMTYTAIPVKEPKITTWRTDIMNEVVEAVRCSAVPSLQIPTDNHLKL